MNGSAPCVKMLRSALLAGAVLMAAGCATSPQPLASQARPAATAAAPTATDYGASQTPMSDARLVASAEFATNALQHGFTPEVRDGVLVYCWVDEAIGSRIPSKKCMDKTQLEITLRQRQAQRDAIEHGHTFGCQPGINCAEHTSHALGQ